MFVSVLIFIILWLYNIPKIVNGPWKWVLYHHWAKNRDYRLHQIPTTDENDENDKLVHKVKI